MSVENRDLRCYVTQAGFNQEAQDKQYGRKTEFTHLLIDGDALPDASVPGELTAVQNEVKRYPVSRVFADDENAGVLIVEAVVPADDGGFTINGIGLETSLDVLYAYARGVGDYKPQLAAGAGTDLVLRMQFIPANADQIDIKIDPSAVLATAQQVKDEVAAHEASDDPHEQYAKETELQQLSSELSDQVAELGVVALYPEVLTADNKLSVSVGDGSIIVDGGQSWLYRGVEKVSSDDYGLENRTLIHSADKSYHLRWTKADGFMLKDLADNSYNPGGGVGRESVFDTTVTDMLVAQVVTDSLNVAQVVCYRNLVSYGLKNVMSIESGTRVVCTGDKKLLFGDFVNDFARAFKGVVYWDLWFGRNGPTTHGEPRVVFDGVVIRRGVRLHFGYADAYSYSDNFIGRIGVEVQRGNHTLETYLSVSRGDPRFNPNDADSSGWGSSTSMLAVDVQEWI